METDRRYKEKCQKRAGGWRGDREFRLVNKSKMSEDIYTFEFSPCDSY